MRINQFLAHHLGVSRREGDELVKQGLVEINGELANLFDQAVDGDAVRFFNKNNWENVGGVKNETVLFYKPIFSVCTKKDPQDRKTVYDLLPKKYQSLKTAGRLDYMSEGLIVLSNDGDVIYKLTHPSQETSKIYLVALKEKMPEEALKILQKGIKLDEYQLQPCKITLFSDFANYDYLKLDQEFRTWYAFELFEGRNNQIRQMCEAVGYKVQRLIRIKQGNYKLTKQLYEQKIQKV
jgi:23S rRNA pseudouridine2605 synthase